MTDIQKEGDGGGGFGDGGGTAFTSTDAGIFTPTHSERGRKPKKEKRTGVHRLADFLTDNSPERKMAKGDSITTTVVNLINWVKMEMRHEDELKKGHFRQQTSGETINSQPPRIGWYHDTENKEIPNEDNPVEFDAKPDKTTATRQKDEERRIRMLDDKDDKKDSEPTSTGSAAQAAPAGLNIRLSNWESGAESDELKQGGDKDKKQGEVEDLDEEVEDTPFEKMLGKDLYDRLKSIQNSRTKSN